MVLGKIDQYSMVADRLNICKKKVGCKKKLGGNEYETIVAMCKCMLIKLTTISSTRVPFEWREVKRQQYSLIFG